MGAGKQPPDDRTELRRLGRASAALADSRPTRTSRCLFALICDCLSSFLHIIGQVLGSELIAIETSVNGNGSCSPKVFLTKIQRFGTLARKVT